MRRGACSSLAGICRTWRPWARPVVRLGGMAGVLPAGHNRVVGRGIVGVLLGVRGLALVCCRMYCYRFVALLQGLVKGRLVGRCLNAPDVRTWYWDTGYCHCLGPRLGAGGSRRVRLLLAYVDGTGGLQSA